MGRGGVIATATIPGGSARAFGFECGRGEGVGVEVTKGLPPTAALLLVGS